jgi:hypothetical protein
METAEADPDQDNVTEWYYVLYNPHGFGSILLPWQSLSEVTDHIYVLGTEQ